MQVFSKLRPSATRLKSLSSCWLSQSRQSSTTEYKRAGPTQDLPKEADVVIIGGGSLGCNTLYSLAKLGITNVVLLEKDKLTAGTTWHTAGLVWSLRPNDVDIQLLGHTKKVLQQLEDETGIFPGWINNGGIFIANNKERLDEYKRLYTIGKAFGIESFVLDPAETKKLYPLMNVEDIYGTLYSPTDGTVDPNGFCTSLTRFASRKGAKVIEGVPVTDIVTEDHVLQSRKVTEVVTDYGSIKTGCVVNCTGAWANDINAMVDVRVPLIAMKHAYITTEKIPGIENTPNVRDHDASVYLKLQGDALHIGGYEYNPILLDKVDRDFAFGLYELDWDVFGCHIEGAINRLPILETIGIKSTVCGPESFTPDHKPIMGEDPKVRGFFHGVGFNSGGMMFGGGCGNELAKWIVHGRPELDMYGYDIRRFCPETSKNVDWVKQRSHEAYAKNYSMVFPHDEPLAARNMKKDPLHSILLSSGCVFQERFGWERPGWFSVSGRDVKPMEYDWYGAYDGGKHENHVYEELLMLDYTFDEPRMHQNIRAECLSTRTNAALFDMSYFGKFYLTGPDAQAAADWVFTNNMNGQAGKTTYTCMLNSQAGIEADLTVSVIDSGDVGTAVEPKFEGRGFYIAAAGGAAFQNYSHILQTLQNKGFNVSLEDRSRDMGMMALQGPKARDILQRLVEEEKLDNEHFPFSTHKVVEICGHRVRLLRVSFVGELGWELHCPSEGCEDVYRAVMAAGEEHGIVNAGYRAIDSLSIEKGYPHWHQEIRIDDTPLETGLLFTCKLKSDTDFLGRKALEEQRKVGAKKKKVCFTLEDRSVTLLGLETIFRNGEPVGFLRRGDYAFHLDKPIAYGYIHHPANEKLTADWLRSGTYELEVTGRKFPANIHLRSPFDPTNDRIQGDYENIKPDPETLRFLSQYREAIANKDASVFK